MRSFGTIFGQSHGKQNYVLQETVVSEVEKSLLLQTVSVHVEADNVKTSTTKVGPFSIAVSQRIGKVKQTSVGYKNTRAGL